jgi:hypothetical protein
VLTLLALLAVSACSSPQSDIEGPVATATATEPTAAPVSTVDSLTSPTASAQPIASAPSTSTPTVPSVAPPDGPIEKRFLPLDAKCEKDSDCAVTKRGVHERLFCCDACDAAAGTKAWVARADLRCSAYDKEASRHACPARDCAGPRGARCNHGACELVH